MTTRATITLPTELYDQVAEKATTIGKSISEYISETMQQDIASSFDQEQKNAYKVFKQLEGAVSDANLNNLSNEIDEVLYGENGAWRGNTDEENV